MHMAEPKKLEFSCLKDSYLGQLPPDDVKLFYYDIGFENQMNSFPYLWNDGMKEFCERNGISIEEELKDTPLPQYVSYNEVHFTEYYEKKEKQDKAIAFLYHLRNAFAHYRITLSGDSYCFRDEINGKTTMIGKIDKRLFRDLIKIYFEQKAKAEEEYRNYLYPEL